MIYNDGLSDTDEERKARARNMLGTVVQYKHLLKPDCYEKALAAATRMVEGESEADYAKDAEYVVNVFGDVACQKTPTPATPTPTQPDLTNQAKGGEEAAGGLDWKIWVLVIVAGFAFGMFVLSDRK